MSDQPTPSPTIQLPANELARLLRVPKDMVRAFMKHGAAPDPGWHEARLGGMYGIELACFAALAHMLERGCNPKHSGAFFERCLVALANDQGGEVLLAVTESNKRIEHALSFGRGGVPWGDLSPNTQVYNLTELKGLMREAITQTPLRLPTLGDVECLQV